MSAKERAPRRTPRAASEGTRDGAPATTDEVEAQNGGMGEGGSPPPDKSGSAMGAEAEPPAGSAGGDVSLPTEEDYRGWFSSIKKAVSSAAGKVKDAVAENAKDVIKAGLPWAGSAIGGFFGGPAGATLGGKAGGIAGGFIREFPSAAEEAEARALRTLDEFQTQSAQLTAITNQVLDQTLPVLIDEIARDFADRAARGEGGPADDEVMERFWGKAFGKLAGVIADELPWAIKKVTQYLGDDGSRDVNAIDPLMLDPEVAQRFWGPAFSTIVTSIQSMLPTAFDLISGKSRSFQPAGGTIDWQQLESASRLPGGDDITVTGMTQIEDPTAVELGLTIPDHKSWFKCVQVRGADDAVLASVEVEGATKTSSVRISADALQTAGARLVFAKADGLYTLPKKSLPELAGQRVDFYWYAG